MWGCQALCLLYSRGWGKEISSVVFYSNICMYCLFSSGNGKKVAMDVESKTGPEILEMFGKVAGATEM